MKIYYTNIAGMNWDNLSIYVTLCEKERIRAVEQAKSVTQKIKGTVSGLLLRFAYENGRGNSKETFRDSLPVKYNEYGKPYMENTDFCYSISHAGDYVFLCVNQDNIGIDVEQVRKNRKVLALAKRFFTEEEYKKLLCIDQEQERDFEFTRIWTQKESYMKFIGQGLSYGMSGFYVDTDGNYADINRTQTEKIKCIELDVLNNYCVSVCCLEEEQPEMKICEVTKDFLLNYGAISQKGEHICS